MSKQEKMVQNFFNSNAIEYKEKYSRKNKFYEYFFYERLEEVTKNIDFNNKNILDIGHGTGGLYDFISDRYEVPNFFATDISCDMLKQSNLKEENRFCGNCYDANFPVKKFDYIFMLGVSTYIELEELNKIFESVHNSLADDGVFIITFTNRKSISNIMRGKLSFLTKLVSKKDKISAQPFKEYGYSVDESKKITQELFSTQKVSFLNHTFFPFSRIFPLLSIKFAKYLKKRNINREYLSSDFILFLR